MNNLAPIGISTYTRIKHLKQTIYALQKNQLAEESELYLFSDAPKPGDEKKVKELRDYLKTIKGFKKIHILERKKNSRVNNSRGGIRMLLDQYGKMILLEEDIVTAPNFLHFMNEALNFYKSDQRIFSICGYTPKIKIPKNYKKDIFISPRFSGWGVGLWRDRYDKIIPQITEKDFHDFVNKKKQMRDFVKGGVDMLPMLEMEAKGLTDALDVRIFYTQFIHSLFTVHPIFSLTNNIGIDGSGVHCGSTKRFDVDLSKSANLKFTLEKNLQVEEKLICRLRFFREGGINGKLLTLLKKMGLYSFARFIKHRTVGSG